MLALADQRIARVDYSLAAWVTERARAHEAHAARLRADADRLTVGLIAATSKGGV